MYQISIRLHICQLVDAVGSHFIGTFSDEVTTTLFFNLFDTQPVPAEAIHRALK